MSKATGFNYSVLEDAAVRRRVQEEARTIHTLIEKSGACIVEIGQRLNEVRDAIGSTDFRAWLKGEFQWSPSVGWNYMQAARRFGHVDCLHRFQPSAIVALARRNVPAAAVKEAIQAARNGTTLTNQHAKAILSRHGVQPTRSDAGKPRSGSQPSPAAPDVLATLQRSLDTLAGGLDTLAQSMPRDQREALADRFLQLALQLRTLQTPAPAGKRKRAQAAA